MQNLQSQPLKLLVDIIRWSMARCIIYRCETSCLGAFSISLIEGCRKVFPSSLVEELFPHSLLPCIATYTLDALPSLYQSLIIVNSLRAYLASCKYSF